MENFEQKENKNKDSSPKELVHLNKILPSLFFLENTENIPAHTMTKIIKTIQFKQKIYNHKDDFNIYKFSSTKPFILFSKIYAPGQIEKALIAAAKIIYFCYRKNFPALTNNSVFAYTYDSGWGCMIRVGQMIMARALYKYFKTDKKRYEAISTTLDYFLDVPICFERIPVNMVKFINYFFKKYYETNPEQITINSFYPPFGIHSVCKMGEHFNKKPGEWFSDINMVNIFRVINNYSNMFPDLRIITFRTCVFLKEIIDQCFEPLVENQEINIKDKDNVYVFDNKKYIFKKCGVVYVSVRLGIDKIAKEYHSSIKDVFNIKECLGIIGGETGYAHYFIGVSSTGNLLYLDPHQTKDALYQINDDILINEYLIKQVYELNINNMSTGMTFGFIFRNFNEFKNLVSFFESFCVGRKYPCFGYELKEPEIDENLLLMMENDFDDF